MLRKYLVQPLAGLQDLLGVDVDVRRLTLESAQRLVNQYARMRQAEALALGAPGEQQGAHAGRLADAHGADVGFDELHGVVDGESGGDHASRRVDVKMNVLVRVLGLQKQKLGDDQVGDHVFHRAAKEYHPLFEQPGVNVIGALAPGGLLHHDGHEVQGSRFGRSLHVVVIGH